MDGLEDEGKLVAGEEFESYLQEIHEIHSGVIGGPSGIVVPPYRLQ